MGESLLNVQWRHVYPPKDGVGQIGFTDLDTGEVIRMRISVEHMRHLAGAIIGYIDANPSDLQECLKRINQRQTNG
jgi:hypothetical protein